MSAHALIINLDTSLEESYTVGAFSIVKALSEAGVSTSYFDNTELPYDFSLEADQKKIFEKAAQEVKGNTRFIGIGLINSNVDLSLKAAFFLRNLFPHITLGFAGVFIGSHNFNDDYRKSLENFDFYINGKGEDVLKNLINWSFDLNKFEPLKGLSFCSSEGFHHNKERVVFENYQPISYTPKKGDSNYVETSFSVGYPYRCSFCSQHFHDPNFIRTDVEDCIKELRPHSGKIVFMTDAVINSNHKWLAELCQRMIDEELDVQWYSWFRVSPQMNDKSYLELLYASGCRILSFGLESASGAVLKHMKKFNDEKQIYQIFDKVRGLNKEGKFLKINLNIIAGYPTETEEDFQKTYFILKKNSDIITDVSINPALLNLELKDFKKLQEEGEILYAHDIHNWASKHSTPAIRLERLDRLRKLLQNCKIKFAIHNEAALINVLNNKNKNEISNSKALPPITPSVTAFGKINGDESANAIHVSPPHHEAMDAFDYNDEQLTFIVSKPTFLNRKLSGPGHSKFELYRLLKDDPKTLGYELKEESINVLCFLIMTKKIYEGKLSGLNKALNLVLPWLSFHSIMSFSKKNDTY